MSNLRKKLIRLAYQKPELRGEILPLLKTAAGRVVARSLPKGAKQLLLQLQANPDSELPLKESTWLGPRRWDHSNTLGNMGLVEWGRHGLKLTPNGKSYKVAHKVPIRASAKSSGDPNVDQAAKDIVTAIKKKGWPEPSWLYDPNAILLEWGSDQGNASVRVGLQSYRGKPTAIFTTPRSRPMRSVAKAIGQLIEDSEKGVQKTAYGMKSVAKFYTLAEAVAFVESYKHDNVRIEKELDGRFHVYDMR